MLICNNKRQHLFAMTNKNYYQVLKVPVTASLREIKRAYRQLAQQYHPDKSGEDTIAAAYFTEIKEAYEVLSDVKKRQEYYYNRFNTTAEKQKIQTPATILQECIELRKITSAIGYYHIDIDLLQKEVEKILSYKNINILKNNSTVNFQIVNEVLTCCQYLPYTHLQKIKNLLLELANQDQIIKIQELMKYKKQGYYWNKYKLPISISIALLLCLLMFLAK